MKKRMRDERVAMNTAKAWGRAGFFALVVLILRMLLSIIRDEVPTAAGMGDALLVVLMILVVAGSLLRSKSVGEPESVTGKALPTGSGRQERRVRILRRHLPNALYFMAGLASYILLRYGPAVLWTSLPLILLVFVPVFGVAIVLGELIVKRVTQDL